MALNAADVERIQAAGKIAVVITIEGGRAIDHDLGVLRMFHRLGVRSITLAWSAATTWIDSHNEHKHGGLTEFGRDVVREMQALGMVVDISHVSDQAFYEVLDVAERPVFASHSSCRALWDNSRNMTDDMIRELAGQGGVINVNFVANFIGGDESTGYVPATKIRPEDARDPFDLLVKASPDPGPPLSRVIDHITHAIAVAGPEHVGIGSDFDGTSQLPQGLDDVSKLPLVTAGLLQAGHAEETVAQVLGLNNLRLFKQTMK
jgi:membrane dipeptidase